MRVRRNHHRETREKTCSCGPFCGVSGEKCYLGLESLYSKPFPPTATYLDPPSWLDPLGDAEGEAEAVPSSSSSSYASKKHTETGFAIITWNNPKNWRNPVSPRDLLPVIFYGWFSHVTRSLWWTPWNIGKSEFHDVEIEVGWWDLNDFCGHVFPIEKWWDVL